MDTLPSTNRKLESVPGPVTRRRTSLSLIRDLLPMLIIVMVVVVGLRIFFMPYEISGASMTPALIDGERLFVNRSAYTHLSVPGVGEFSPFTTPQRGDIVVLESDITSRDAPYIKRIVALPGETISFTEGIVVINGQPLVEDYIDGAVTECIWVRACNVTIPVGNVYVLGDHRADSEDSRIFGPVPLEDIVGRAFFSSWPYEMIGPIPHPDYGEVGSDS